MKLVSRWLMLSLVSTPLFAANTALISDSKIASLKQATLIGPAKPDETIQFTVWFQLRNQKLLNETLKEISTIGGKQYHHFLTKEQVNSTFVITNDSVDSIKKYFISEGLTILPAKKYHFYMSMKGTVAQVEHAFHVQINHYRYQGKVFYANSEEPVLPKSIAPFISQITGLNTLSLSQSSADVGSINKCTKNSSSPVTQSTDSTEHGLTSSIQAALQGFPTPMTFTGFILGGPSGHGYTPAQIQKAYGVDILQGQGITGTGQTIKIIDSCISENLQTDLNAFQCNNQIVPPTSSQCTSNTPSPLLQFQPALSSGTVYCGSAQGVEIAEITLDVEGASTMAPGATLQVYWDPDWQTDNTDNLAIAKAITEAIDDSDSWGLISSSHSVPEKQNGFVNIDPILSIAYLKGVSVNISSGDCGDNIGFAGSLQVNYPSDNPMVTAVGASQLFADNNGNYITETGWGTALNSSYTCTAASGSACTTYASGYVPQGPNAQGFIEGTTGGLAQNYVSWSWQQNAISNIYAGGYGIVGAKRAVPDISIFGESHYPGFEAYVTPQTCSTPPCQPTQQSEGGTSLATPFFTGILALVNQERQLNSKTTGIGLAAQYLYNLSSCVLGCPLRPVNNPHGMGNPVAGIPNPNAFQLYQVSDSTYGNFNLYGVVFNFDSSLTLGAPGDRWNDAVGVGTPYAPVFVAALAGVS